ncbi:MAG: AAA family ATPase [Candidatus Omnitrophica bacterium]|nr:AAA family ATPase [Candidatus Omnitrophota bacterium]
MLIDPVVGERFFGREDVLATIEKRISALKSGYRQNIAITGHRLTGKSSILNHFLNFFKDDGILPIYLEVFPEPFRQFASKFIGTLLYNYLKYSRLEVRDDLDYLISECGDRIPETVSSIKNILKQISSDDIDDAYSELLNLTSLLKKETNRSCVVILDEFHNLSTLGIRDPFKGFGKKIMTQKDTLYIVASSEVTSIKKILSEKLALLFGNFETITLGGFDCKTSEAFLKKKLYAATVDQRLLDFIIAFADGHPFYLDALSGKMNELTGNAQSGEVTVQTVVLALEELLFDSRGTLNQFFINLLQDLLDAKSENCRDALIGIAHGIHKQKELSRWAGCSTKEISKNLKILTEKNLIYRSGSLYRFYDKVLRFWLQKAYHKRRTTLVNNISDKAMNFRADTASLIQQFFNESRMCVPVRIKNLLDSFNNEIVHIGSKNRRLIRFDSTEVVEDRGKDFIVCRLREKLILVYCPRGKVDENDVLDFISYSIKYKPMLSRRVIMTLDEIDINAKIMAKEMKMRIWDSDAVNELLDIYGKQKIVRITQ